MTEERPGSCVVCHQVDPREGMVCDRDRLRLAQALWELRDLHQLLPAALEAGCGAQGLVRVRQVEAGMPLRADPLDLAGRAPASPAQDAVQDYRGDQQGAIPVAAILDSWAQDWAILRDGEELPAPNVAELVSWLSVRLPWALDYHPAVDEFARELTVTLYVVRSVLAVSRRPIYSPLACPSCGVAALRRQSGDKVWRCAACKAELEVEHPVPCECGVCPTGQDERMNV